VTPGQRLVAELGVGSPATAYGDEHVDVPVERWVDALTAARDVLGFRWLDFIAAYEDGRPGEQMTPVVVARLWSLDDREAVILRTSLEPAAPALTTATGVYAGARWHEREVMEMFGITFEGHPDPRPLLLADSFEGHPMRKAEPLMARSARPWPGAVEPDDAGRRARRRLTPPGVSP
jgi:NADH-quinone oxidoreductase subunit C